nr:sugar phosphate isomerase/epimerase family protein [Nostoc sp. SerVER01]
MKKIGAVSLRNNPKSKIQNPNMPNNITPPNIACAAWGWREVEIPEYFRWISNQGIRSVEVNAHPQAPKHLLNDGDDESVSKIATWAQEAGVDIICIAGRNNFTIPEEAALKEEIQRVERFVDIAQQLGAKFVRLLSGDHRNDHILPDVFPRLHYAFNRIGDYAEERGIKITIENHGGPTATGQRVARIMEGIKSPAVGVNYDPANFLNQGTDPLMALRYILPWVNYSHWKDVRWVNGGPQYCVFGEGEIVWQPIIQELLNSGYQGYWVVEYEETSDVEHGTKESVNNLCQLLEKF